jgi:hypothetical protein
MPTMTRTELDHFSSSPIGLQAQISDIVHFINIFLEALGLCSEVATFKKNLECRRQEN